MDWLRRLRKTSRTDLDALLSGVPKPEEPLHHRLQWLARVFHWIFSPGILSASQIKISDLDFQSGNPQALRIKWLLHVLNRHNDWQNQVHNCLRSISRETRVYELFIRSGLHRQSGLFSEVMERISRRVLPLPPQDQNLEVFFFATFKSEVDAQAISRVDASTFLTLCRYFDDGSQWRKDAFEALRALSLQIAALGDTPGVRERAHFESTSDSPFYRLHQLVMDEADEETVRSQLLYCKETIDDVYRHMDEHGVSVALVYHLDRINSLIDRCQLILPIEFIDPEQPEFANVIQSLVSTLIRDSVHSRSLRGLFDDNTALIAKKIVENSAETGDHYIARSRIEERDLLGRAFGGGALTAITTVVKFFLTGLHTSPFMTGVLASLNYALSFQFLQAKGFSLATKQPAMTAATLAKAIRKSNSNDEASSEQEARVSDEIINTVRSQGLAVLGNVAAVIPGVYAFCFLYSQIFNRPFLSAAKAQATVASFDILGPTPFYAAWTGVLLFTSSLIAGWFYHWILYRRLPQAIGRNETLISLIGAERTRKFSVIFKKSAAGFAANTSLGFLLGLSPLVFQFIGLPLDVRHVTLSTGSLTAAIFTLGPQAMSSRAFLYAALGIALTGVCNILFSFGLALAVAFRSERVPFRLGLPIFGVVSKKLMRKPSLIFGPRV